MRRSAGVSDDGRHTAHLQYRSRARARVHLLSRAEAPERARERGQLAAVSDGISAGADVGVRAIAVKASASAVGGPPRSRGSIGQQCFYQGNALARDLFGWARPLRGVLGRFIGI